MEGRYLGGARRPRLYRVGWEIVGSSMSIVAEAGVGAAVALGWLVDCGVRLSRWVHLETLEFTTPLPFSLVAPISSSSLPLLAFLPFGLSTSFSYMLP